MILEILSPTAHQRNGRIAPWMIEAGWGTTQTLVGSIRLSSFKSLQKARVSLTLVGNTVSLSPVSIDVPGGSSLSPSMTTTTGSKQFIKVSTILKDDCTIEPNELTGCAQIPFRLGLPPKGFPPSYEDSHSAIQYFLTCTVTWMESFKILKSIKETKVPIIVMIPGVVRDKLISTPSDMIHHTPASRDKVTCSLSLESRVIHPGSTLVFHFAITHIPSGKRLHHVYASLESQTMYRSAMFANVAASSPTTPSPANASFSSFLGSTPIGSHGKSPSSATSASGGGFSAFGDWGIKASKEDSQVVSIWDPTPLAVCKEYPNEQEQSDPDALFQREMHLFTDASRVRPSLESPLITVKNVLRVRVFLAGEKKSNLFLEVPIVVVPNVSTEQTEILEQGKQLKRQFSQKRSSSHPNVKDYNSAASPIIATSTLTTENAISPMIKSAKLDSATDLIEESLLGGSKSSQSKSSFLSSFKSLSPSLPFSSASPISIPQQRPRSRTQEEYRMNSSRSNRVPSRSPGSAITSPSANPGILMGNRSVRPVGVTIPGTVSVIRASPMVPHTRTPRMELATLNVMDQPRLQNDNVNTSALPTPSPPFMSNSSSSHHDDRKLNYQEPAYQSPPKTSVSTEDTSIEYNDSRPTRPAPIAINVIHGKSDFPRLDPNISEKESPSYVASAVPMRSPISDAMPGFFSSSEANSSSRDSVIERFKNKVGTRPMSKISERSEDFSEYKYDRTSFDSFDDYHRSGFYDSDSDTEVDDDNGSSDEVGFENIDEIAHSLTLQGPDASSLTTKRSFSLLRKSSQTLIPRSVTQIPETGIEQSVTNSSEDNEPTPTLSKLPISSTAKQDNQSDAFVSDLISQLDSHPLSPKVVEAQIPVENDSALRIRPQPPSSRPAFEAALESLSKLQGMVLDSDSASLTEDKQRASVSSVYPLMDFLETDYAARLDRSQVIDHDGNDNEEISSLHGPASRKDPNLPPLQINRDLLHGSQLSHSGIISPTLVSPSVSSPALSFSGGLPSPFVTDDTNETNMSTRLLRTKRKASIASGSTPLMTKTLIPGQDEGSSSTNNLNAFGRSNSSDIDAATSILSSKAKKGIFSRVSKKVARFVVIIPHTRQLPDELDLVRGDLVCIKRVYQDAWCFGYNFKTRQKGVFPLSKIKYRDTVNHH